jgi:hypothetical protein
MSKVLMTFAIVCTIAIAGSAFAQTPNIQIYFDEALTQAQAPCPDAPIGSVTDTMYVVANNFGMWMSAVEFMVEYPIAKVAWIADLYDTPLHTGSSPTGTTIGWSVPKNAFDGAVLLQVLFVWNCQQCGGSENTPWRIVPNPMTGYLRAVEFGTNQVVDAVGMLSVICATTPVENSTWGQIKALYR